MELPPTIPTGLAAARFTAGPAGHGALAAPAISVIVPVHRQWDLVPLLLEALGRQTVRPAAFETIIVNNDAPEAAPPLALPPGARIVPCTAAGSYPARNAGAREARGDWLAFTDADCLPDPRWLAALLDAAAEARRGPQPLLAGPVRVTGPADPGAFAIYDMVRGIPQARYVSRGYAATANLAVPAEVFRAVGGFDPARRSGGDAEFCRRAGRAGHRMVLVPAATVAHPSRTRWDELAVKARRIKGGQIAAGPLRWRIAWTLRTLSPPVRDTRAYLGSGHPWRHRLIAVAVRFRLWGVELAEMVRLLAGGTPERR